MVYRPETATEKLFRHLKDGRVWDVMDALKCGADPHAKNREGSALMVAARHGELGSLKLIIGAGAKLDERDSIGDNVLMTAVRHGQEKNIRHLMELGIDIRVRNDRGETAADIAEQIRNRNAENMALNAMDGKPQAGDRLMLAKWEHLAAVLRDKHTRATTTELLGKISVRNKPLSLKPRM